MDGEGRDPQPGTSRSVHEVTDPSKVLLWTDFERNYFSFHNSWAKYVMKLEEDFRNLDEPSIDYQVQGWRSWGRLEHRGGEDHSKTDQDLYFSFKFLRSNQIKSNQIRWRSREDGSGWWSPRTGLSSGLWVWQRGFLGATLRTTRRHRRRTCWWGSPSMTASRTRAARSVEEKVGCFFSTLQGAFHLSTQSRVIQSHPVHS